MPLVAHSNLPTFDRLRRDGQEVLSIDRALSQDLRELHIGFLNMMPDAALQATERQFMRLIGACNRIAQFYVHPFTIDGVDRLGAAKAYVDTHYSKWNDLQRTGLDALIITGANVTQADITRERFWDPLIAVAEWAHEHVCSVLCSCLASHALFKHYHSIVRTHLDVKQWGVYSHRVLDTTHPLTATINTRFDAPHSRFNDVPRSQLEAAGLKVLVESEEAGVHLAVSADQFRWVFFQGHPEYDINSLLKEYKREVGRFIRAEREDYPPYPEHYFGEDAVRILDAYKHRVIAAVEAGRSTPTFPEQQIMPILDNTWTDTGKAIFNAWLGFVYQLTHRDRRQLFMPGVDADDPLGIRRNESVSIAGSALG